MFVPVREFFVPDSRGADKQTAPMSPVFSAESPDENLGVSYGAVGFLAGFHGAGDGSLHVSHCLLGSASPSLSRRCGIIDAFLHGAGDVVPRFLS